MCVASSCFETRRTCVVYVAVAPGEGVRIRRFTRNNTYASETSRIVGKGEEGIMKTEGRRARYEELRQSLTGVRRLGREKGMKGV